MRPGYPAAPPGNHAEASTVADVTIIALDTVADRARDAGWTGTITEVPP